MDIHPMAILPTTAAPLSLPSVVAQAQAASNTTLEGWPTYLVNPQTHVTATPAARNESYLMQGQSAITANITAELYKEAHRTPVQLKANMQSVQPLPTASQLNTLA
jgi:hypothetical protein